MTSERTYRFLLVVILLCVGPPSGAADPNAASAELTFENGATEMSWAGEGSPRPSHAAGITLYQPPDTGHARTRDSGHGFVNSYRAGEGGVCFSQKHEAFLRAMHPSLAIYAARGRITATNTHDNDPNYYHVVLYAVSEKDARKMAQAYVGFLRRQFDDRVRIANRDVERLLNRMAFRERRIPELDATLETSRQRLDELMVAVLYRTEDEAQAAIGELNKMINAARVDIAGVKAKLEAIQDPPAGKRTAEITSRLEAMFVEEAIALRAAEARKREATDLRAQAVAYIDLNRTLKKADEERKSLAAEAGPAPVLLERKRANLAKLKKQAPKVLDNKVFIYPVSPLLPPVP